MAVDPAPSISPKGEERRRRPPLSPPVGEEMEKIMEEIVANE
jgi:hypothetical protein